MRRPGPCDFFKIGAHGWRDATQRGLPNLLSMLSRVLYCIRVEAHPHRTHIRSTSSYILRSQSSGVGPLQELCCMKQCGTSGYDCFSRTNDSASELLHAGPCKAHWCPRVHTGSSQRWLVSSLATHFGNPRLGQPRTHACPWRKRLAMFSSQAICSPKVLAVALMQERRARS